METSKSSQGEKEARGGAYEGESEEKELDGRDRRRGRDTGERNIKQDATEAKPAGRDKERKVSK